jgi:AcrR family transcriptional regulator
MRATNGRADILRAARNTFARKGYDGASIRDIAQEAGLSLSALYYYFPSKQDALYELITKAFEWYIEHANGVIRDAGADEVDRVASLIRFVVRYRAQNGLISRVTLRDTERLDPEKYEKVRELQRISRAILTDVLSEGMASGVFRIENPDLAGRAILSIVNSIPLWYREGGPLDIPALERSYTAYCLRLLGYQELSGDLDRLLTLPINEDGTATFIEDEAATAHG